MEKPTVSTRMSPGSNLIYTKKKNKYI